MGVIWGSLCARVLNFQSLIYICKCCSRVIKASNRLRLMEGVMYQSISHWTGPSPLVRLWLRLWHHCNGSFTLHETGRGTGTGKEWTSILHYVQYTLHTDIDITHRGSSRGPGSGPVQCEMRLLHLSLSQPQPQPTEPQPNVFIVFISLNKSTKRPYMVYTDKMCFYWQ